MGAITTLEQFHREMREFDRKHGPEDYYSRRLREKREEEERQRRREPKPQPQAQQQTVAERKLWEADWNKWAQDVVEGYLHAALQKDGWLCDVIGGAIGMKAKDVREHMLDEVTKLRREVFERCARLPVVRAWEDKVHYTGDVVVDADGGGVYQARCDTGRPVTSDDWICLARAGKDGHDGITPRLRGGFDAHERYRRFDIVTCYDNCYIARRDDPGLPGHDDGAWQLIAKGSRGPTGADGPRGQRGARGPRGEYAPEIIAWTLDVERYVAHPTLSNGKAGAPLDIRPLFERFCEEAIAPAVEAAVEAELKHAAQTRNLLAPL